MERSSPSVRSPSVRSPSVRSPGSAQPTPPDGSSLGRGPYHPERADIIEGSWLIGTDFPPALYSVPVPATHCGWRVVDPQTGVVIDEGDYSGAGPATIWLQDGDLFQTEGCLLWQGFPQLTGSQGSPTALSPGADGVIVLGDGVHRIGAATAGRYRRDRSVHGACSYEVRRAGTSGRSVVVEAFTSTTLARAIPHYLDLTVRVGDEFSTHGCGSWVFVE